jgi:glycosyltransferase involved in cell wall biosynthesis
VLNSADTLPLTLSSVAAQTYPNIEHIVVDGGSTDGTVDVLRTYRSAIPLRWVTESDSGMYAAINKGIALARGDILSYLNSDDYYLPWSAECAVRALSGGAEVVFGDALFLTKRDGIPVSCRLQFYPRFDARMYAHEVVMAQATVFWRREVVERAGAFDDQLRYSGDFEYWLRAAAAGFRYMHVREVLAVAVEHEKALSTVHAEAVLGEIEVIRDRYRHQFSPRRGAQVRRITRLAHWRTMELWLRLNYRRANPSSWHHIIPLLKNSGVAFDRLGVLELVLPIPLRRSWSPWRANPITVERTLIEEIQQHASSASP